jgi:hypothetical protein
VDQPVASLQHHGADSPSDLTVLEPVRAVDDVVRAERHLLVGLLQEDRIDDAALQCVVRLLCRPADVHVRDGVLDLIGLAELDPEHRLLAEVAEADRCGAELVQRSSIISIASLSF